MKPGDLIEIKRSYSDGVVGILQRGDVCLIIAMFLDDPETRVNGVSRAPSRIVVMKSGESSWHDLQQWWFHSTDNVRPL